MVHGPPMTHQGYAQLNNVLKPSQADSTCLQGNQCNLAVEPLTASNFPVRYPDATVASSIGNAIGHSELHLKFILFKTVSFVFVCVRPAGVPGGQKREVHLSDAEPFFGTGSACWSMRSPLIFGVGENPLGTPGNNLVSVLATDYDACYG